MGLVFFIACVLVEEWKGLKLEQTLGKWSEKKVGKGRVVERSERGNEVRIER